MGAQQSTQGEERVFESTADTPIRFSQSLINDLSDTLSPTVTPPDSARQATLDEHIRSRINSELARLRAEEQDVREQIEEALARENAEKEKGDSDGVLSTDAVVRDITEIKSKVERHHEKRDLKAWPEIQKAQRELVVCYNNKPKTPLECWRETEAFKTAVADAEKSFVASLR